jgi:thiol-disulfide isomerase/thioredoxin
MKDPMWKMLLGYLFVLFFMCWASVSNAQIVVTQYNAEWNDANKVSWLNKLSDCDITKVDIVKQPKLQTKHKIVVVPTIIVFKDGEEVKRFQADVSFKMAATREEIQDYIDELIMSDF